MQRTRLLMGLLVIVVTGISMSTIPVRVELESMRKQNSALTSLLQRQLVESTQQKSDLKELQIDFRFAMQESGYLEQENTKFRREMRDARDRNIVAARGGSRSLIEFDLRTPSYLTPEELDAYLAKTNLNGLGRVFYRAEVSYHVNALAILSMAFWESKRGTSDLAKEKNNLFGWKAYTEDVSEAKQFGSLEECILEVAHAISRDYLSDSGMYHNGYTLRSMNILYASDPAWAEGIATVWSEVSRDIYGR